MAKATATTSTAASEHKRAPRGEYAKSKQTRRAILDAAVEVFAQSGYRAGSLREVAQRVGMSEAGLLHHFRSKRALLLALLDHRDELSRALVDFDVPDGVESLRSLAELARFNAAQPGIVELYCTLSAEATSPDHPAHDYFVRRYDYVRTSITNSFERAASAGRLADGVDPARAAVVAVALMDGLQVQWLLDPGSTDMADALHEVFRSLIRGYDVVPLERVGDDA